jgi:two-component system response regulator YesN
MAYNLSRLFDRIKLDLGSNPRLSLAALSLTLKIERHTIEKAVRVVDGRRFRDLRNELLLRRAKALLSADAALSIKEVAYLLGYRSPQAFARFVRRVSGYSPSGLRVSQADCCPTSSVLAQKFDS